MKKLAVAISLISMSLFSAYAMDLMDDYYDTADAFKDTVLICKNSKVYHDNWCAGLIRCSVEVQRISSIKAKKDSARKACKTCYKDKTIKIAQK